MFAVHSLPVATFPCVVQPPTPSCTEEGGDNEEEKNDNSGDPSQRRYWVLKVWVELEVV